MKLFHLSDLHIGLKLHNRDLAEDHAHIFDQIAAAARRERPDAILIAGDLYDKPVPSAEAVALFDRFIGDLRAAAPEAALMCVSGNHDSAQRINVYRGLLARQGVHMIGLPPQRPEDRIARVTHRDAHGPVDFYLLPFVRPSMVRQAVGAEEGDGALSYGEALRRLIDREQIDPNRRSVLVSHQFYVPANIAASDVPRADSEIPTVGNIDAVPAELLAPFDYAALGHIHRPMAVGRETARYCGTPLQCSLSEAGQQKAIAVAELGAKGDVRVRDIPLTPLRQVRVIRGPLREVLAQACDDYVSAVLTDAADQGPADARDRLSAAFPNLLEIRRETAQGPAEAALYDPAAAPDPYALCVAFLGEMDAETRATLSDIVNTVREVNRS